ncbi:AraC family transcriptional regulator [Paenibacillus sedimenti]|uniref:AraC family transcriptional regulator n=1 Tax=Paenibacillus sedimenti TaxID=2770274 RepID=A0A926KNB2_9BACL|nr:AraC family transcriptional regulator [Paenibacillus sedimenti]MBD0380116.1 AraC family transcriptional regulator [Paenibacillus sedimenti]
MVRPTHESLPSGLDHMVSGSMLPDLQVSFRLFAAHRRKVKAQWSFPEHRHALYELNLVLEGTQHMQVDRKDYQQKQGDLLWILPGSTHASLGAADGGTMEYVCVHMEVDDPWFRQQLNQMRKVLYPAGSPLERILRPILQDVANMAGDESAGELNQKLLTMHASFRLFAALCEVLLQEEQQSSSQPAASELAARIAASIEEAWMNDGSVRSDDRELFRIEQIAEQLGYSPTHCNRVFQKAYGISPRQYLSTIKLRKAKLLLMDPTQSVEQIAEQLGYKDLSQFSKQFKRWTGMSPTAYRHLSF